MMKPTDTTNVLAWLAECRLRNANSLRNTATGLWLAAACDVIERQFNEIQDARNEMIDRAMKKHEETR